VQNSCFEREKLQLGLRKRQKVKSRKAMERRGAERFYSKGFKERVLTAYYSISEPVSVIALRFDAARDTVSSRVYRKRTAGKSGKRIELASLESVFSAEKMRLGKMIAIAGRELKIDTGKKSGARQFMR
jgi:transposase-like protein